VTGNGRGCEEPGERGPVGDWHGHGDGHGDGCVTCGDAAEWVRVVDVHLGDETAICVDARARRTTVDTGLVGAVDGGDALLVHAGVAIHREPGATADHATADR